MTTEMEIERLLDNAATCSQVRELLRDDEDEETPLRECVRINVALPLVKAISGKERKAAESAIDLFLEYRDKHGRSEEEAKFAVLAEFDDAATLDSPH